MVLSELLLRRSPRQNIRWWPLPPASSPLQGGGETRSEGSEPRLIRKDPPLYFEFALSRTTGLSRDDVATRPLRRLLKYGPGPRVETEGVDGKGRTRSSPRWAATSERRGQPPLCLAPLGLRRIWAAGTALTRWAEIAWISALRSRLGQPQIDRDAGHARISTVSLGLLPKNTDVWRCAKSRAFSDRLVGWVRFRSLYHSDRERTAILS